MASKRSHPSSVDGHDEDGSPVYTEQPMSKKPKNHSHSGSSKSRQHQNSHIDPTWGQKYVFSSLDDATTIPVDLEDEFEDDGDAMAYLKSVRVQATGIPHLLVAPRIPIGPQLPTCPESSTGTGDEDEKEGPTGTKVEQGEGEEDDRNNRTPYLDHNMYERGKGDFRGRYVDGAYIGQPETYHDHAPGTEGGEFGGDEAAWDDSEYYQDTEAEAEAALYDAYFASLLDQYHALRAVLQRRPPPAVVSALPPGHGFNVGNLGPRSPVFKIWNHRLCNTDPLPAQVASMDKDGVLRLLRILLSGRFLRRGSELHERTSRWLWALLARLPERGEMNHVEIGWVRDLGRRAVLLSQSLADMANLREALEGEGVDLGVHEGVDESSDDEEVLKDMEVVDVEEGGCENDEDEQDGDEGEVPSDADAGEGKGEGEGQAESNPDEIPVRQETAEVDVPGKPGVEPIAEEISVPPPEQQDTKDASLAKPTEEEPASTELDTIEDGEIEEADQRSEPMDMDCSEDGEVADDAEKPAKDAGEDIEAVRARILAQLEHLPSESAAAAAAQEEEEAAERAENSRLRARMNMRATLNMILTVAGEFYGQRDLLEFRDLFTGM